MNTVFGESYADAYDAIYAEKDYDHECDVIERLFATHAASPVRSVLDVGCGTGNHSLPLARRGYSVVGVDLSQEMLARARTKLGDADVTFLQGDARTLDLGRTFDAVLLLFAVLGYQTANEDVLAALRAARRHLSPGGLLVLDVWYGPAVLRQRPSARSRTIQLDGLATLERSVSSELDVASQSCRVEITVERREGGAVVAHDDEAHTMRFFFPMELGLFFDVAGFRMCSLTAFPEVDDPATEETWNVAAVAVARDGISKGA